MGLRPGGTIGRSETLESVPAAVHGSTGEVIGGMTLVRVLPKSAPAADTDESEAALTTGRIGDRNWLDFN